MKILLAPNSMKGSLDAFRFADRMEAAFRAVSDRFEIRKLPIADGGDGTGEVLINHLALNRIEMEVTDPLGRLAKAEYGLKSGLAVIEMASASGMKLLQTDELNPMKASSFGTGQLIADAIKNGALDILLGLGGSATVDAGMGLIQALGIRFYDASGKLLKGNGQNLGLVVAIDTSQSIVPKNVKITIVCDVTNPLTGEHGAARVFGPQKGANPQMVEQLEANLIHFSEIIKKQTGKDVSAIPGGGAAGGIPASLVALLDAHIVEGADFILDTIDFDTHLAWADVVITGEGRLDEQSLHNKAPFVVAQRTKQAGKKVYAVVGSCQIQYPEVFDEVFEISTIANDLNDAIKWADELVYMQTCSLVKELIEQD